ncbi:uncharacterized protein I206_100076 [Kwoniella pini CBS 10737]|uniref:Ig-like domain-containing protein n=1 Tax=Kwoniella pini CBS 10737 TaxID=1296096 RepID=A0A1B9HSG5_9TREE|nr:uncharacterized protein I206_07891 [Kwoniella pini CBS 10737]OCF46220.1 hypothetical protein I206_07891 [Kwoniella pini CBS 10737]
MFNNIIISLPLAFAILGLSSAAVDPVCANGPGALAENFHGCPDTSANGDGLIGVEIISIAINNIIQLQCLYPPPSDGTSQYSYECNYQATGTIDDGILSFHPRSDNSDNCRNYNFQGTPNPMSSPAPQAVTKRDTLYDRPIYRCSETNNDNSGTAYGADQTNVYRGSYQTTIYGDVVSYACAYRNRPARTYSICYYNDAGTLYHSSLNGFPDCPNLCSITYPDRRRNDHPRIRNNQARLKKRLALPQPSE